SILVVTGSTVPVDGLVFRLTPLAAISGFVTNQYGEPVSGMQVDAFRTLGLGKRAHVSRYPGGSTDDRGHFRIFGLPADSFTVVVSGRAIAEVATEEPSAFPLTYFPGTTQFESAGRVQTTIGQEAHADIKLNPVPTGRVVAMLPQGPEG